MTRRADTEITKAKRKVLKLRKKTDYYESILSDEIGYNYKPSGWEWSKENFSAEEHQKHEVTESRYLSAERVVVLKNVKKKLKALDAISSLSKTQEARLATIDNEVREAVHALNMLPPLGQTSKSWVPGKKSPGHPKISLEEEYINTRKQLNLAHALVNELEKKAGIKPSTIEQVLASTKALNAGRNAPDSVIKEIEELEKKRRSMLTMIEQIKDENQTAKKGGRGKRKAAKQVRLEKCRLKLLSLTDKIENLELTLSQDQFVDRFKRLIEREKRYAKKAGKNKAEQSFDVAISKLKVLLTKHHIEKEKAVLAIASEVSIDFLDNVNQEIQQLSIRTMLEKYDATTFDMAS